MLKWGGYEKGKLLPDEILKDYQNRDICLTEERWQHILSHPEMVDERQRLEETLLQPEIIVVTVKDAAVHRFYEHTPVTRKYMIVVVKFLPNDAFILTAFFSSRLKKGTVIWQA